MTVCEFISEPWEWLHEASSRVSDRIYICNRKKNEKIKNKLVSKSVFKPGAFPFSNFGTRQQTILNYVT